MPSGTIQTTKRQETIHGILSTIGKHLKLLGLWFESRNQQSRAVYEAAIEERIKKHKELKSGIGHRLSGETNLCRTGSQGKKLKEIMTQLPLRLKGEDDVALVLIQKKDTLTNDIEELSSQLKKIGIKPRCKVRSIGVQAEIEKLKREKDEVLAKKANAEAVISIQETLSGLSTDATLRPDNVREHVNKLAEADIGAEIGGDSLDAKLAKIKERLAKRARVQLDEMKKQMAAKSAAKAR